MTIKAFVIANGIGLAAVAGMVEYKTGIISDFFNPCSGGDNSTVTLDSSYGDLVRGAHCGERSGFGLGNGVLDASEDLLNLRAD